jgi:aminopeptidase N
LRERRWAPAAGALLLAALAAAGALAAGRGSPGLGDPFFPRAGNGGYDVKRYALALRYRPASGRLTAVARIRARAHKRLDRLNLDLGPLRVTGARIGGRAASVRRRGSELVLHPSRPPPAGASFTIAVRYRGVPRPRRDADGSLEGWFRTSDGAFVVGEPLGTQTWAPVNNHPTDKARWRFHLTVPARLKAVANGRLARVRRRGRLRTWTWKEGRPMAPYLATVNIGRGSLTRSRAGGVPSWVMVDPREAARSRPALRRMPQVMRFLSRLFGPYPFGSTGAIVDRARRVGYALETQTRPAYDRAPGVSLVVHEIAHQWFGNSVTPRTWPHIWLNEGFATWAEWIWAERHGGPSARRTFRSLLAVPAARRRLWNPPPGRLRRPRQLFATSVYLRGAMALQALRMRIGTRTFLGLLRRWAAANRYGNATIPEFRALAESVSGRQLDGLFDRWLLRPGKPVRGSARDPAPSLAPRVAPLPRLR